MIHEEALYQVYIPFTFYLLWQNGSIGDCLTYRYVAGVSAEHGAMSRDRWRQQTEIHANE